MCGLLMSTKVSLYETPQWRRALDTLACRGPDACGESVSPVVVLGHRRLEVIGLGSPGSQPFGDPTGTGSLVYNGEIYNYRDLASQLRMRADSDTHVLFEILKRERWDLLQELRGMFAFAYWNEASEVLVTARDPFGIKPLYFWQDGLGDISFASVAASLAHLHSVKDFDPVAITGFLAAGFFPSGCSAFSGIAKLAPGDLTFWAREGKHWQPRTQRLSTSCRQLPVTEAIENSVAAHMVADVPVGVLMSGGVDSTLMAALAKGHVDELRTYSITNPNHPEIDEASYAAWNASQIGTIHTEVPVTPDELAKRLSGLLLSSGEPFGDPAFLPLAVVCERASQDLKVVLAGEGADELFGGYKRYEVEKLMYGPAGLPMKFIGGVAGGLDSYKRRTATERVRTLAAASQGPGLLAHSLLMGGEWPTVAQAVPSFGAEAWQRANSWWQGLEGHPDSFGLPRYQAFDLRTWLPNVYLEKSDRASMMSGLEVRVPFVDRFVAQAASSHVPRNTRKEPLRRLLNQLVPDVRLPPRKKGLGVATLEVLNTPDLAAHLMTETRGEGIVGQLVGGGEGVFWERMKRSGGLKWRVAVLGAWAREWNVTGF